MENNNDNAKDILAKRLEDCSEQVESAVSTGDYTDLTDRFVNVYKLKLDEKKIEVDERIKTKQLESENETVKQQLELKKRELDLKESELKASRKQFIGGCIKEGVTLAAWIGMSLTVMNFEKTGAIMSKAFAGVFPKTKI